MCGFMHTGFMHNDRQFSETGYASYQDQFCDSLECQLGRICQGLLVVLRGPFREMHIHHVKHSHNSEGET